MIPLARAARMLAAFGIASVGLTGCFSSEPPLISKEQADYPFNILRSKGEGGEVVLRREEDGYFHNHPPDGNEVAKVLLYKIKEDIYAVQMMEGDGALYAFARKDGNKILLQDDCGNVDADELARLNIQRIIKSTHQSCEFQNLNDLIQLGQSPALWSRGTKTTEIISIE